MITRPKNQAAYERCGVRSSTDARDPCTRGRATAGQGTAGRSRGGGGTTSVDAAVAYLSETDPSNKGMTLGDVRPSSSPLQSWLMG